MKTAATWLLALVLAPTPSRLLWPATAARIAGALFIGFGLSKFTQHARETRALDSRLPRLMPPSLKPQRLVHAL